MRYVFTLTILSFFLLKTSFGLTYFWNIKINEGYMLNLKIPWWACQTPTKKVLLFLSSDGKVYRKTLKGAFKKCFLKKEFKKKTIMKVIIFYPESLKIRELGVINP
jgi:hypothetical protein